MIHLPKDSLEKQKPADTKMPNGSLQRKEESVNRATMVAQRNI